MERIVVLVTGTVQGVGYRAYARQRAMELGLCGYAENLSDGRVEVVAEGPREELEQFLEFLRQGPRLSRVTGLDVQWSKSTGLRGFSIR
ncbi:MULTISPECIES: acylphosphatase [unclassified Meiothermus]|uniref:acylphosphatase n=1 Tax=unclassified Meiothermus TaxID=370471 RepID=UPI000D7C4764|nr:MULTISPECIES: acylphosphatase [unclassified Meiothermus]PZA08367.1 acylphosphatase [Meiothermus sp. Pnk-1]RYM36572.1 acylphosphatase [Meiothermus sp. PNK-Is4]